MTRKFLLSVGVALTGVLVFAGTALAQGAVAGDNSSVLDLLTPVLEAFRGGDYAAAGALALVVLVAVARQYGSKVPGAVGAFLAGELGAATLVLVGSFAATLAAMVSGPGVATAAVVWTAAKIAFYASGGFALAKKFAYPVLVKLRAKLPGWAAAILDVLLWVMDGGKAAAIAKAEKAGKAAVDAKPSPGAGEPEDFS